MGENNAAYDEALYRANINLFKEKVADLRTMIQNEPSVPNSREKSLVLTKLDEAFLWLTQM